ncbi:MAG: PspA/IM30 family protein [Acidobacteriaceae bacterium]|nr:PspA/IM30 family protein [Acidobacteriaceae bacterium]MBV9778745.1 PspA/IM30 family protein [Acidobacteriaceae bacterium]
MALLERVTTLIKANVNDLIDKAENPEKLVKQLLLDMQNQFMQVKTQVAIAIADQHLLEKKQHENLDAQKDWVRKAELALEKNQEDLARVALERSLTYENAAHNFAQQIEDQSHQVQLLRDALHKLEQKMTETKAKADLLVAQHRRARLAIRSGTTALKDFESDAAFDRLRLKVSESEALGLGHNAVGEPGPEQRLAALERADQVERLLADLRTKTAQQTR